MLRLTAVVSVVSALAIDAGLLLAQSRTAYQVIDTIRVDSLMREAPISSLSELLNNRILGVHVTQNEAVTGGDVQLQIRSPNSMYGSNEPILIVDGARYAATAWMQPFDGGVVDAGATNPLNDLDPNDVELIEVLKGPSAAALYGSGAANGVLLITTKQGRAGRPRWNLHARRSYIDVPEATALVGYRSWGHDIGGGSTYCTVLNRASCLQDSVTVVTNPLDILQPTAQAASWMYGANMSGGIPALRYYLSANLDDANGFSALEPPVAEARIGDYGVSRLNVRSNIATELGKRGDLRVNAAYLRGAVAGSDGSPFRAEASERNRRWLGSIVGQYRPASWLLTRATLGYDRARRVRTTLGSETGTLGDLIRVAGFDSVMQRAITVDLAATATARSGRVTARTTLGMDRNTWKSETEAAMGSGLPDGSTSPSAGMLVSAATYAYDTKVRGLYLDETLSLNERLFVTGGLRSERMETNRYEFDAETFPTAGVRWLISEEPWIRRVPGVNRLQIRYAYGVAGLYGSTRRQLTLLPIVGLPLLTPKPERVSEHEYGVDISGLRNRLSLGLTRYSRRTKDQLVGNTLPGSVNGGGSLLANLGSMSQDGFEVQLGARVLDTRWLSWRVLLQHATSRTEVDDMDDVANSPAQGYVEGYPLGAMFRPGATTYADVNNDGVLQPSEIQITGPEYVGETTPRRWQALGTTVGMFQRHVRLSALLERRSGHMRVNTWATTLCRIHLCRAGIDPTVPLADQAAYLAIQGSAYSIIEPSDFTRLREVSAAVDLPSGIARALRGRSLTVTLAARNLAVWSDFSGGNPETGDNWPAGRSWMLRLDLDL